MRLPDANVLIYAVNTGAEQHDFARTWLHEAFAAPSGVALAWVALLGFLRVSTHRAILPRPLKVAEALRVLDFWLGQKRARLIHPTHRHTQLLGELLVVTGTGGNLTTDAHLAALAMEHGATLASFDRDFARFDGLAFEQLRA